MDLSGSLATATWPIVETMYGSLGAGTGSSLIDTVLRSPVVLTGALLQLMAGAGADVGSTLGA
ncbi:hypothetical protein [Dietzia sp. ANT_WB102]|uniref:hypothetical protein n=1 Tax=Dietzia sp. ANT_WB102 TaxID=2597345 RepID=UPI0011EEC064|nr:hypothetical protein [Dietzia sp. ANT_WB102]KAA0916504.1 hypothetical protein FQ137_14895 [Dietzia sp. ANT_WB102]